MNPAERLQKVASLYQAARARHPEQRAAFLAQACADDETLRAQIESLLAQPDSTTGLVDDSKAAVANTASELTRAPLVGQRLGTYHVLALLGVGGMGEVYRARDTRLGRDVALKVLPHAFTADADRLARFEREARVLAAINHPNIATIHGVEVSDGVRALVMELVEGSTLGERLRQGPLPVSEVLRIGHQIADALDAAHAKGIVHRDLKPANIKVTPTGTIKVLDFGLAKAVGAGTTTSNLSEAQTVDASVTRQGLIVGTVPYMSPEQARGEPVTQQTDIWSFGCVLFELFTGSVPFNGRSAPDVIAAILRAQPEWAALPPLHPRIALLLERCLEKDTTNRYHAMADARADLQKALADPSGPSTVPAPTTTRGHAILRWAAAAAVIAVIAGVVAMWTFATPRDRSVRRFSDVLPPGRTFTNAGHPLVAVSRDGTSIAYVADSRLFVRVLDQPVPQPIAGTEGTPTTPFFSPDGRFLGYFDFSAGELRRIAVAGGTPVGLIKVTNVFGARWTADDTILYGAEDGVWRVPARGGTPQLVIGINPGERVHAPQVLPDGKSVLFTWRAGVGSLSWEDATVVVQSLETGQRKTLQTGADARYLSTGHLVYAVANVLFAMPFNVSTLETTGPPTPIIEGIRRFGAFPGSTGSAHYDVSENGTLVYIPGRAPPPVPRQLVAVDRNGNATPLVTAERDYWRPRVSPDGSRVVVEVRDERGEQLWVVNLKDGTSVALITEGGRNVFSTWAPDGESVIFRSDRGDRYGIYRQRVDGTGAALLFAATEDLMPGHVSHEGVLVFASGEQTGRRSIWTLRLGDPKATAFLATPALEHMPQFSPDGKWVAYASNESGRSEVYIRSFSARDNVRRISEGGGTAPVWAPDGSELYFRSASGMLTAVPLRAGTSLTAGVPRELFKVQGRFRPSGNAAAYDIEPSGRRFIMTTEAEPAQPTVQQVNIVLNWTEELKRLVPTR